MKVHVPFSKPQDSVQQVRGTYKQIDDCNQLAVDNSLTRQNKSDGGRLRRIIKPHIFGRSKKFSFSEASASPKLLRENKETLHTVSSVQHSTTEDSNTCVSAASGSRWAEFLSPEEDLEDDSLL